MAVDLIYKHQQKTYELMREELKRSKIETEELIKNIQGLSKRLGELGFVINGRDYSLECFDNRQMRVESAKYGFVVQYRH